MNAQEHLARIHELPCMICLLIIGVRNTQVEAHHIGDSSERSDWLTIPLCAEHHRGKNGFHGAGERAFLDTFLGTQALPGKRTAYDRVPEYRQGPAIGGSAPTSVFLAIKFRDTYLSLLTGVAGILQTEVTEAVQYSGTRNIEKGLPTGNSIIQQVGIVAGRRTVTCKAVSTTPTAAQAWIRTIRNALLLSAQSTPGAYEEPARVQTQYLFLPQISGVVTGANVNVKLYEVTGTFSEILPDYGFTP